MRTPRSPLLGAISALVVAAGSVGLSAPAASAVVGNANLTAPGLYQCVVGGSGPQVLNYSVSGGQGGGYQGGAAVQGGTGANLAGTMTLTSGQTVYITVGSNGFDGVVWPIPGTTNSYGSTGSSGGGYSSIALGLNSSPIVVAGGGGGGGAVLAPGGSAIPGSTPQGKGNAGNGGNSQSNQGMTGGILAGSGKGGSTGGGNGGTQGNSGATASPTLGGGGGGAGFGQTVGGAGDWNTATWNAYQFTNWNGSPVAFGGGGGGGLWSGGGGGGWSGGGGGGGQNEYKNAGGGGGGGGSSLLATNNTAGVTATQSSASGGSTAGSASLSGVTCNNNVTYMANGGNGSVPVDSNWYTNGSTATVASGNNLTGPYNNPYFIGWSTTQGQSTVQYAPGSTITVNGPTVLWAQYAPGTTVNFNTNGGSGSMLSQNDDTPTALSLNAFTRPGYGFVGWNTAADGSGTSYADGATYPFSISGGSNTILYAQWAPVVTVTYNGNGSSYPSFPNYQTGYQPGPLQPVTGFLPPNGYVFTGWNTQPNGSGTTYQTGQTYAFNANLNLYAQYAVAAGIDFNGNGGTGTMNNQIIYQNTPINPNLFVRSGYVFTGWNTAANGSGTAYLPGAMFTYVPNTSTLLYAQWVLPSATVTFSANGGSGSMNAQTGSAPTNLALNGFTAPNGKGFTGWNTAANGGGTTYANGALYPFTANVTLYAQWGNLSTVTFDANGGTGSMSAQTSAAPAALNANAFSLVNNTFVGWNTAANGTGMTYADGGTFPFAANTILYAQWSAVFDTITFNASASQGGQGAMAPLTVQQGRQFALPQSTFTNSSPTMMFDFWSEQPNGSSGNFGPGAPFTPSGNVTLYAQWKTTEYSVAFVANGGSGATMPDQTSTGPAALNANTYTAPAGQQFTGWNTHPNGSGVSYANQAVFPFNYSPILYAQWASIPATVTFDANGGTGTMPSQQSGTATPLAANTFTRNGYYFTGWNTAANGSGTSYANGATFPFTSSVTMYAQWTQVPNVVTFSANGGTGVMNSQTGLSSAPLNANTYTRSGYSFVNWTTAADGTGTSYLNGAPFPFTSSVTLYAQWTPAPTSYTVTFNANGGIGTMTPQSASAPTALTSNAFTNPGEVFVAWNTAANGSGTTYVNGATYPFSASVTLYAQWADISSKVVTFNANGGSGSMAPQVSGRAANLKPNTFSRSGYTFASWNTAANGTGVTFVNQSLFPFTSDVTLYAQWTAAPTPPPTPNYTVTFDANGGVGSMAPQTASIPTALVPNSYTRAGYVFTGWNTAVDGSGAAYANGAPYPFGSNATLYAQWGDTPAVVTGLKAAQTKAGHVTVSWVPLAEDGVTYRATIYSAADVTLGSCVTQGRSCAIAPVRPGTHTVMVTATVSGVTGRPALTSVTVVGAKPVLTKAWRGSGKDAKRAYASVALPKGADPAAVLVWTETIREGKVTWLPRSAPRDGWTCRYFRSGTDCTWERVVATRAKVKFSVNGMFSQVAAFPSARRP